MLLKRKIYKKIYARNLVILEEDIGKWFSIHQGLKVYNLNITKDLVGYKFGEFSYTRKLNKFKGSKKKKKKNG